MEAVLFHSLADQPISPQKTTNIMKTHKSGAGIHRPFVSRASENFVAPLNLKNNTTGLLQAPPLAVLPFNYINLSQSYPPFSMQKQQQQPPLLPLPISSTKPHKTINIIHHPPIIRGLSCPPITNRKTHNKVIRSRDSSLTPKKSKTINPTAEESLKPLRPEPKDLPKDVPKNLTLLSGSNIYNTDNSTSCDFSCLDAVRDQIDEFSGPVVFTISPPPSSLPLPTFSLRPKLSCNAEAAGIDAGATDNLCRLLRLR